MPKVKREITTTISVAEVKEAVRQYLKIPANDNAEVFILIRYDQYDSAYCDGASVKQVSEGEI